jgi:hypothetical protein
MKMVLVLILEKVRLGVDMGMVSELGWVKDMVGRLAFEINHVIPAGRFASDYNHTFKQIAKHKVNKTRSRGLPQKRET